MIDAAVRIRKNVLGHHDIDNVFLCANSRIVCVLTLLPFKSVHQCAYACESPGVRAYVLARACYACACECVSV